MILGFAHFGKQPRKLKKNFKKQARKSNEIEHEKPLKNQQHIPKTMKKPSKKRHVFRGPQKSCFFQTRFWNPLLEGQSDCLSSKINFLLDFQSCRDPQIRRHRPVSGVSNKRSQQCQPRRLVLLTSGAPPLVPL